MWWPLAACWVRWRAPHGPMLASRRAARAEEKKIYPKLSNRDHTSTQTLMYRHVDQIKEDQARVYMTNTLGSTTPMA
jgi:hypothetical protein